MKVKVENEGKTLLFVDDAEGVLVFNKNCSSFIPKSGSVAWYVNRLREITNAIENGAMTGIMEEHNA